MKISKLLISFSVLVGVVLLVVGCTNAVSAEEAYVTIDINPSIELIVNNKDIVVYANPMNEDGEVLLSEITVVGLNVDDASDLIIATAIDLGYINVDSEETVVSVSTISDSALAAKVQTRVKAAINNAFMTRAMMGKATDKVFNQDFINEAASYGVTPAFLFLAQSVTYVDDTITLDDALAMSQEDLRAILVDAKEAAKEVVQTLKDEFMAERDAIKAKYADQITALQTDIADLEAAIAAATDDTTDLEAQLAAKQEELQAVLTEMHDEIAALRAEFVSESNVYREQYKTNAENRRSMYSEKVNNFLNNKQSRMEKIQERIRTYQNSND